MVQQRTTKLVPCLKSKSYPETFGETVKAEVTNTKWVEKELGDVIEVFKIMNGLEDIKEEDMFMRYHNWKDRGHKDKIVKPSLNKRPEL